MRARCRRFCWETPRPFFPAKDRLKAVVPRNVDGFLEKKRLIRLGLGVRVDVHTRRGTLLYPPPFENSAGFGVAAPPAREIAEENYRLLTEGLEVVVDVVVDHNTPLSNLILGFYVGCGLLALFFYYRRGTRKDLRDQGRKSRRTSAALRNEPAAPGKPGKAQGRTGAPDR